MSSSTSVPWIGYPSGRTSFIESNGVRIHDAHQHDIHEESLSGCLERSQRRVRQVAANDARIVRPVPRLRRRSVEEVHPARDTGPRRLPLATLDDELRFDGVAQEVLVYRAPPRAAGHVVVQRIEDTPSLLPTHECDHCPPVGPIPTAATSKCVGIGGKTDPTDGIIAHL